MTKIKFQQVEPQLPKNSFESQPKIIYRAGTAYSRTEEAVDQTTHTHRLAVINEPNAWLIDLTSKTGEHIVDSSPPFRVHMPVFTLDPQRYNEIDKLEYANEVKFFLEKGATRTKANLMGTPTHKYDLTVDKIFHVTLWTSLATKKPLQIRCADGQNSQTIRYLTYDTNLKFSPDLFAPPKGVTFTESH